MAREQTMYAKRLIALCFSALILCATPLKAADAPSSGIARPDPLAVQRYGPAYRYPQAGWIVLHIEGQPYERGYQHGRLLAPEILEFLHTSAVRANPQGPTEGWTNTRRLVNVLFMRQYEQEFLEEMKGIADGANDMGVRWDSRPLDLLDIVALNAWPEVETLDTGLNALPTGFEGKTYPNEQPRVMPAPKPMHCSAFAATGPATKDGKIVFGHITMFSLYASEHYNVWLDVKPAKGHRVMMQTYPAGIQSGMDYYQNDVGLLVTETTISQTRFDIKGQALASRIRQAMQYGSSIDDAVAILSKDNNGLYTNEWLLADTKTNEIAMFELGTHKTKLYRSSKNEWFGDTPGFYWGCNNTKDREVRLETFASVNDRPVNVVYHPSVRDEMWVRLYEQYKGKMDVEFGKIAFTTPPLAAHSSLDAKFTTTDMANRMESWALFGPPLGRSWQPRVDERKRFPEIKPLISNPWTILHGGAPVSGGGPVADLPLLEKNNYHSLAELTADPITIGGTTPAWRGTLFPATSGDIWLATAFAEYEHIVAAELARQDAYKKAGMTPSPMKEAEFLAGRLYGYRTAYLSAAAVEGPTPLQSIKVRPGDNLWYRQAAGKGVLSLHALREFLGLPAFIAAMDKFGTANAGKEVTTEAFLAHCERETGKPVGEFMKHWLRGKELPAINIAEAKVTTDSDTLFRITGIQQTNGRGTLNLQMIVETDTGMESAIVEVKEGVGQLSISTKSRPKRITFSPADAMLCNSAGAFALSSFMDELEKTLIVYGSGEERASNLEAAQDLQQAIITQFSNMTIPYKSDKEVSLEDLKSHHLLLIGRPDNNSVVAAMKDSLPITFGARSFKVQDQTYAHAGSSVLAAAANPHDPRYSIVVIAGLSAESAFHAAPSLMTKGGSMQVLVLPDRASGRSSVILPAEWSKDLTPSRQVTPASAAGSGK
jgi:Phospholipase B